MSENEWSRTCPLCNELTIHKNRAKCYNAERLKKICIKCSRTKNGKANSKTDTCPICNEQFIINEAEIHANSHSLSSEELWLKKMKVQPTLCGCGCGEKTTWSWCNGYHTFLVGHNANIWSSYSPEKALEISEKRKAKLRGVPSWSKGLTKETDERIKKSAEKMSETKKEMFASGDLIPWSKGKTKETEPRLEAYSQRLKDAYANGDKVQWHKGLTSEIDDRIKQKNEDLRDSYANGDLTQWHKGKNKHSDPRIAKFHENRNYVESYKDVRFSNEEISSFLNDNKNMTLQKIDDYRNQNKPALLMQCVKCKTITKISLNEARIDYCKICNPRGSIGQNKLADWIEHDLNIPVERNVWKIIKNRELDIVIPTKSFAIEFNGLFYHNENAGKLSDYHQSKTERCLEKNIQLIHVFEDEWIYKQNIVKSIIQNKLSTNQNHIMARKCDVIELSPCERKSFFNANHLEGDTRAIKTFALKHNDQLVQAISLRIPQHKKYNDAIEVARSCSLLNTTVTGGLSRLMKYVKQYAKESDFKRIITYVDMRFGTGKSYELAGFQFVHKTQPRFWWTNCHQRFNRFKFRANKKLGLTEKQVALNAGVTKIWGCSNKLYELVLT